MDLIVDNGLCVGIDGQVPRAVLIPVPSDANDDCHAPSRGYDAGKVIIGDINVIARPTAVDVYGIGQRNGCHYKRASPRIVDVQRARSRHIRLPKLSVDSPSLADINAEVDLRKAAGGGDKGGVLDVEGHKLVLLPVGGVNISFIGSKAGY